MSKSEIEKLQALDSFNKESQFPLFAVRYFDKDEIINNETNSLHFELFKINSEEELLEFNEEKQRSHELFNTLYEILDDDDNHSVFFQKLHEDISKEEMIKLLESRTTWLQYKFFQNCEVEKVFQFFLSL